MSNKRVALITGAARGIGKGIALKLAEDGFNIVINDIAEEKDASSIAECKALGAEVLYARADISKADGRESILTMVKEKFGRLDVLVNNAGVAPRVRADILEATEESYDFVMTINLKGPYFLTQILSKWMIELKKADPSLTPMIINTSSISAYTSSPGRGEYCLSKAGIAMMTKLYADRLAEYGINVFEIRPGIIKTDMTSTVTDKYDKLIAEGITPIKRWGLPEDIAKAISGIAANIFPFSTGEVINVDGGFHLHRV